MKKMAWRFTTFTILLAFLLEYMLAAGEYMEIECKRGWYPEPLGDIKRCCPCWNCSDSASPDDMILECFLNKDGRQCKMPYGKFSKVHCCIGNECDEKTETSMTTPTTTTTPPQTTTTPTTTTEKDIDSLDLIIARNSNDKETPKTPVSAVVSESPVNNDFFMLTLVIIGVTMLTFLMCTVLVCCKFKNLAKIRSSVKKCICRNKKMMTNDDESESAKSILRDSRTSESISSASKSETDTLNNNNKFQSSSLSATQMTEDCVYNERNDKPNFQPPSTNVSRSDSTESSGLYSDDLEKDIPRLSGMSSIRPDPPSYYQPLPQPAPCSSIKGTGIVYVQGNVSGKIVVNVGSNKEPNLENINLDKDLSEQEDFESIRNPPRTIRQAETRPELQHQDSEIVNNQTTYNSQRTLGSSVRQTLRSQPSTNSHYCSHSSAKEHDENGNHYIRDQVQRQSSNISCTSTLGVTENEDSYCLKQCKRKEKYCPPAQSTEIKCVPQDFYNGSDFSHNTNTNSNILSNSFRIAQENSYHQLPLGLTNNFSGEDQIKKSPSSLAQSDVSSTSNVDIYMPPNDSS